METKVFTITVIVTAETEEQAFDQAAEIHSIMMESITTESIIHENSTVRTISTKLTE